MIVDTRDPKVIEVLEAWFESRDELDAINSKDDPSDDEVDCADSLRRNLIGVGDELVALLCPTVQDRPQPSGDSEDAGALSYQQTQLALGHVAVWLGKLMNDDGSPCPTGLEASRHALGPILVPDWAFGVNDPVRPTIILEGGPEDWAYRAGAELESVFNKFGVHAEAYACYALQLYPHQPVEDRPCPPAGRSV